MPEKNHAERGPETSLKVQLSAALFGLQPGVENLEAPQSQRMVPDKFQMNSFFAGVCVNQTCQVPAQRPTQRSKNMNKVEELRKSANMMKGKSMQSSCANEAKVHSETRLSNQPSPGLAGEGVAFWGDAGCLPKLGERCGLPQQTSKNPSPRKTRLVPALVQRPRSRCNTSMKFITKDAKETLWGKLQEHKSIPIVQLGNPYRKDHHLGIFLEHLEHKPLGGNRNWRKRNRQCFSEPIVGHERRVRSPPCNR